MKDKTFNARNDELRARRTKANEPAPDADYKVDDSPAMQKKAAHQRAKGIAATAEAQPGSIEALADATDAAIRAASPMTSATKAKKKNAASDAPTDAPAPKATKKKDAAIVPDKVAPDSNPLAGAGAASTDLMKAAAKKSRAKSKTPTAKVAKADWLDTGLERTGKLTVNELARAWIAHLDAGGKTTASTIASYGNDLKTAVAFFGAASPVAGINAAYIDVFNNSDGVMKLKNGAPKAMPTILKMRRAFRMAVEWARENSVDKG